MNPETRALIEQSIVSIPDYPQPGIIFRDITSLMENAKAYQATIDELASIYKDQKFTKVVGTEARGFLFGAPLALALGVGFVPVRKPGKLPRETISQSYELEYGTDTIEIHKDAVDKDDKVLLVDDLIATGGTAEAAVILLRKLGATVNDAAFVINLVDLPGQKKLESLGVKVVDLVQYQGE
ncbi:adenine phosphoribosyltransferase [Celerinatantimonas sp. MCCC 1A17872]|uniref:adenine phosphoribosyltransferase n=1 Tax=Celerinatantimonas sp. MCCC 1A17872 TaxID=3177514 RepID=UPI0038C27574